MKQEPTWDLSQSIWTSADSNACKTSKNPIITARFFFPGALGNKPDVVFCSSDSVYFCLNLDSIFNISTNAFRQELKTVNLNSIQETNPAIVVIQETSHILAVILHFFFGLSFFGDAPSFQTFTDGILRMSKYGIDAAELLTPSNPCYNHILVSAPIHPLEVYTLAAHFDIYPLAVASSSHLLSYPLSDISDEMAKLMGSTYLKKLFALHSHRLDMMKLIMMPAPYPHPPTRGCDFVRQKSLTRAWTMAAGHYIWEGKLDLSPADIHSSFGIFKTYVDCENCRETLENCVRDLISRWVLVKASGQHSMKEIGGDLTLPEAND